MEGNFVQVGQEARDRLKRLCANALKSKNLTDEKYKSRLMDELKDVFAQNEEEYLVGLYDKGMRYENENNLLVPYLLDICPDFNIDKPPAFNYGEFPDIDVDYLPMVRHYLKEDFSRRAFGDDYVCNIASYTTFGLRSALLDMARVFGLDRDEIQKITKTLGTKDEDGETLTWDTALDLYDGLKEYVERNPDMAEAARRIVNRNRSLTQHASGLIISGVNIKDFVPIVRGKEGSPASAWVEGLHGTDLGAVGLVKYDFLSLDGNYKIVQACRLAKERKGLSGIAALPGKDDWTDTSYLNDTKALEMANKGDLRLIFQFDGSEGIRRLAKQGGVTSFDDLTAYTALYRPGPMKLGYHEVYCDRKQGRESYELHPLLEDVLGFTYGVLTYQEQIMRILNVVGKIPLKDCEAVRKAISKKKVDKFAQYKKMFLANGQVTLGWTVEELEHLWKQIEAFAGYGFNLSHAVAYTYISSRMLFLKAHHPLEFYTAFMRCMKLAGPEDYQKLKEYKQDARQHGVEMCQLDLNKSKENFDIVDDKIYYGFSNIKGIGEEVAARIVENQPYTDLQDFLMRFGTDAKVVQALISLGCFGPDRLENYKYYLVFKEFEKKKRERRKRFDTSLEKIKNELNLITGCSDFVEFLEVAQDIPDELVKLRNKYDRTIMNFQKKLEAEVPPSRESANLCDVEVECEMLNTLTQQVVDKDGNVSYEKAQMEYYGYIWLHPLEKCEKYKGFTFEDANNHHKSGPLEILVERVTKRESKNKKGLVYYDLVGEDAAGMKGYIRVWKDDMERWQEELTPGNLVCIRVAPPTPPWKNYTLEPHPNRYRPPAKQNDTRVVVYQRA